MGTKLELFKGFGRLLRRRRQLGSFRRETYSQRRSTIAKQAKLGQQIKLKARRAAKVAGRPRRDLKKAA